MATISRAPAAITQQRAQADAAQADHRGRGTGLHPRGVDHGTDAGEHGTAEQGCFVERQLGSIFTSEWRETVAYSAKPETPR